MTIIIWADRLTAHGTYNRDIQFLAKLFLVIQE